MLMKKRGEQVLFFFRSMPIKCDTTMNKMPVFFFNDLYGDFMDKKRRIEYV